MKKIPLFFLLILISFQVNAFGYKVSNYVGRIGLQPVHFSLEKKDFGGSNVQGSYYYDKYLSTIPLYGQLDRDSAILCEIHREEDLLKINYLVPIVPDGNAYWLVVSVGFPRKPWEPG